VRSTNALGASSVVVVVNGATLQLQQDTIPANPAVTVTLTGSPTGGNYALGYQGVFTPALAFGATAATIQTALQNLPPIGAGNVLVSGSGSGPFTITFTGALAGTTPQLSYLNNLSGGIAPAVVLGSGTSILVNRPLVLNGNGVGGKGALENVYGL